MTATGTELRGSLEAAVADPRVTTQLLLAWRRSDTAPFPPTYRVELVDLDQGVAAAFLAFAALAAPVVDRGNVIPYDPDYLLRAGECFVLPKSDWPGGDLFVQLDDFLNLARFMRRRLTKPRLYVLAVASEKGTAFFGKTMGALRVLSQRSGVFAAVWDGSTFNALAESVATFSSTFDWVIWDEKLYVLNAAGFHAEFRDIKSIRQAVRAHVEAITSGTLKIINSEALITRCQANVAMASKLQRIAIEGIQRHDIDELKNYASEYGIAVKWDGESLVFEDTFTTQWSILTLLDEDRTEGPVSHRKYEASSKRVIETTA
jgi:hypothetical protein